MSAQLMLTPAYAHLLRRVADAEWAVTLVPSQANQLRFDQLNAEVARFENAHPGCSGYVEASL